MGYQKSCKYGIIFVSWRVVSDVGLGFPIAGRVFSSKTPRGLGRDLDLDITAYQMGDLGNCRRPQGLLAFAVNCRPRVRAFYATFPIFISKRVYLEPVYHHIHVVKSLMFISITSRRVMISFMLIAGCRMFASVLLPRYSCPIRWWGYPQTLKKCKRFPKTKFILLRCSKYQDTSICIYATLLDHILGRYLKFVKCSEGNKRKRV